MHPAYDAVEQFLLGRVNEIKSSEYPEDKLHEFADQLVPTSVWESDTIESWVSMPAEYQDSWKDIGVREDDGIVDRMRVDLFMWYEAMVTEAWQSISEREL